MFRSQEIIIIFTEKNLSYDIIKYILDLERSLLFEKSIYQWIKISNLFYKNQAKKFFYNDIKKTFLNEINYINGDFNILKKYCKKINKLKIQNYNYSLYLNSLRY